MNRDPRIRAASGSVSILSAAVILLAAGFGQSVMAQPMDTVEFEIVLDPAGDVQAMVMDSIPAVTAPPAESIDLTGLYLIERQDELLFRLEVENSMTSQPTIGVLYGISFEFGLKHFRIDLQSDGALARATPFPSSMARAHLVEVVDPEGLVREVSQLEATVESEKAFSILVPKVLITDDTASPLRPGSVLKGWVVTSSSDQLAVEVVDPNQVIRYDDRMPDVGEGRAVTIQLGEAPSTSFIISSPRPTRVSNGEEGAFLYEFAIENTDAERREFFLEAATKPTGWTVDFPAEVGSLASGARETYSAIINIPFRHVHGDIDSLTVHALDVRNRALLGSIDLSMFYSNPPQPAGHHSEVFLHTARMDSITPVTNQGEGMDVAPYFNTLLDDPVDTHRPIGPTEFIERGAPSFYEWCIPLSPQLQLGLHLDQSSVGALNLELKSDLEMTGSLQGGFYLESSLSHPGFNLNSPCSSKNALRIANLSSESATLMAGAEVPLSLTVRADEIEPVIPSRPNQNMILYLRYDLDGLGSVDRIGVPLIVPGANAHLPLLEYQEDPQIPSSVGEDFLVEVRGADFVRAPAGSVVHFELVGSGPGIDLEIFGTNVDWASIIPHRFENRWIVIVEVPADAADREVADLLLKADLLSRESQFIRLRVIADSLASAPGLLDLEGFHGDQSAPGVSLVWLLAACLVALRVRRGSGSKDA